MPDNVGSSQAQNPSVIFIPFTLPSFPSFEVHADSNAGPRCHKWLTRFERLLVGLGINDPTRKRALLLHHAGFEVDEIFDTLSDTGTNSQYDKTWTRSMNHSHHKRIPPTKSTIFDRLNNEMENPLTPTILAQDNLPKHVDLPISTKK